MERGPSAVKKRKINDNRLNRGILLTPNLNGLASSSGTAKRKIARPSNHQVLSVSFEDIDIHRPLHSFVNKSITVSDSNREIRSRNAVQARDSSSDCEVIEDESSKPTKTLPKIIRSVTLEDPMRLTQHNNKDLNYQMKKQNAPLADGLSQNAPLADGLSQNAPPADGLSDCEMIEDENHSSLPTLCQDIEQNDPSSEYLCQNMNIFNILSCSGRCKHIFDSYEKHETLSKEEQNNIIDVISNHFCLKNVEVSSQLSAEIAAQICEIFPNEKIATYQQSHFGKLYRRCNEKRNSRGGTTVDLTDLPQREFGENSNSDQTMDALDAMDAMDADPTVDGCRALEKLLRSWNVFEAYPYFVGAGITIGNLNFVTSHDALKRILNYEKQNHLVGIFNLVECKLLSWRQNEKRSKLDFAEVFNNDERHSIVSTYYHENNILSRIERNILGKIIIKYADENDIYLDRKEFTDIDSQINKYFPGEEVGTYYKFPPGSDNPSGVLYNLYHNGRRQPKACSSKKITNPSKRNKNPSKRNKSIFEACSSDHQTPKDPPSRTDDDVLQECIELLKQDQTDEIYIENWKKTSTYRVDKLNKKVYTSYTMFLEEFPIVQQPIGLKLVIFMNFTAILPEFLRLSLTIFNIDFESMYGSEKTTNLIQNWKRLFKDNIIKLQYRIKDESISELFDNEIYMNDEYNDATYAMVLHGLLPPPLITKNWRPTISSSIDSFLMFMKNPEDMKIKLENREVHCKNNNIQLHPLIFGRGESETQMNEHMQFLNTYSDRKRQELVRFVRYAVSNGFHYLKKNLGHLQSVQLDAIFKAPSYKMFSVQKK